MNCILNHCHEQIAVDYVVIAYYAVAVGVMIVFSLLSQSKTIRIAALMISGVWLFSILYYLAIGGVQYFTLVVLMDGLLAYQFWRMSKAEAFPAALCCLMIADIAFITTAAAFSLAEFWMIFVLNRIFELTLAYIMGASIYRIRKLRPPENDEASAGDRTFKFIAG